MNENDDRFSQPDSHNSAIFWWVRKKAGPLSSDDQAAFDAWLAENAAHQAALDDVSKMWGDLRSLRPTPAERPAAGPRRQWLAGTAALSAAALALFMVQGDFSVFLRSDFYAGTGATKRLTLADGSHIELNAQSAIAIHYDAGQRRVKLLKGEAWFEVSPDPARPFVVEASGGTVTALGTAFDAEVKNAWAHVTVTQHRVAIASGGKNVIVGEGQQSAYAEGMFAQSPVPANIEHATAWRRGKLFFDDMPLAEVVTALGRYHHGQVYLVDPELRTLHVNGVFGTEDPVAAIGEIETSLGLHAIYLSRYLIFLYQ